MGKLEKKAVFSSCCGDETITCYDRVKKKAPITTVTGLHFFQKPREKSSRVDIEKTVKRDSIRAKVLGRGGEGLGGAGGGG